MTKDERINAILSKIGYRNYNYSEANRTVEFTILDDFENKRTIFKQFDTMEEFEEYINMLENLLKVKEYTDKDIKIVPRGEEPNEFDLIIDGEKYTTNYLSSMNSTLELLLKMKAIPKMQSRISQIENIFDELTKKSKSISNIQEENKTRTERMERLSKQSIFKRLKRTFNRLRGKDEPLALNLPISYPDTKKIDLQEYIEEIKKEEEERTSGNYDNNKTFESMRKLFDEIQGAILSGKRIRFDSTSFNEKDLTIAYWIIEQIDSKVKSEHQPGMAKVIQKQLEELEQKVEEEKKQVHMTEEEFFKISPLSQRKLRKIEMPKLESTLDNSENKREDRYVFLENEIPIVQIIDTNKTPLTYQTHDYMQENLDELSRIQKEQKEKLSIEEQEAAFMYKTCFYRQINKILRYMKKTGMSLEELKGTELYTEKIKEIQEEFRRFKYPTKEEQQEAARYSPNPMEKYAHTLMNKYYGNGSFEHYSKFMGNKIIPNLLSALKKVTTCKDLVVYRGTPKNELSIDESGGVLSTTLNIQTAKDFLKGRLEEKNKNNCGKIYRVKIPAGSPILMYSTDLITGGTSSSKNPIIDAQKEIIIDPTLFDFTSTRSYNPEGICYEEVEATPKNRERDDSTFIQDNQTGTPNDNIQLSSNFDMKKVFIGNSGEMYQISDRENDKQYYFKPAVSKRGKPAPYRAYIQEAAYHIQRIINPNNAVKCNIANVNGMFGAIQEKVPLDKNATIAFINYFDKGIGKLSPEIISQVIDEYLVDFCLCNYDAHAHNFIIDENRRLRGIDKEQAFRYINEDRQNDMMFTTNYNKRYEANPAIYYTLFEQMKQGKISYQYLESLKDRATRLSQIPDEQYRKIFEEYAYGKAKTSEDAEILLGNILDRKSNILQNIEQLYSKIYEEWSKNNNEPRAKTLLDSALQAAETSTRLGSITEAAQNIRGIQTAKEKNVYKNPENPENHEDTGL